MVGRQPSMVDFSRAVLTLLSHAYSSTVAALVARTLDGFTGPCTAGALKYFVLMAAGRTIV